MEGGCLVLSAKAKVGKNRLCTSKFVQLGFVRNKSFWCFPITERLEFCYGCATGLRRGHRFCGESWLANNRGIISTATANQLEHLSVSKVRLPLLSEPSLLLRPFEPS